MPGWRERISVRAVKISHRWTSGACVRFKSGSACAGTAREDLHRRVLAQDKKRHILAADSVERRAHGALGEVRRVALGGQMPERETRQTRRCEALHKFARLIV